MFAPDVVSLRQFYLTPLGEGARALIAEALRRFWPSTPGETILGIGYATPYLEAYAGEAASVFVAMPASQGAAYWPPAGMNVVMLAHESELPLPENSVNRVLLVHSLENSEQLSGMMQEVWRVLTPGGRMLAVVPSRLGFWSRSARSPFGYGRPFSMAQLRTLIDEQHFTQTRSGSALFVPPTYFQFVWKGARRIEAVCRALCPFFGGALLIEAEKQVYAAIHQPVAAHGRRSRVAVSTRPVPARKTGLS